MLRRAYAYSKSKRARLWLLHARSCRDLRPPGLSEAARHVYDGVAELWWTSPQAFAEEAAATNALEVPRADEANFIDLPNSPLWFAHEYPQVNPPGESITAHLHSPLVKLFFAYGTCRASASRRCSSIGAPITAH